MYCSKEDSYNTCDVCHGNPLLGTNKEILKAFTAEISHLRDTRANKHASTQNKSMRMAVSIPLSLYQFLNNSMQRLYKEKLFTKEYNVDWFMRKFGKYFQIPQER